MATKKAKARARAARLAPTPDGTPPYTFSFRPAKGLPKKRIEKAKDLLPGSLSGILMDEQPDPPLPPRRYHSSSWSMTMSSSWPESSVSSGPSDDSVYNEKRISMKYRAKEELRDQEHQIGAEARGRHHTELYVMQTNVAVDRAVQQILSSEKLTELFKQVNMIVDHGKKRRTLVASICRLSASVRTELGAAESEYGKFVRCKKLPIVDLKYPAADAVNLDGHIMVQAAEVSGQRTWSNMVSFVVVKRTDEEDLNNKAVRQGLFYVCRMHQYRPITSHVHFATWCGHFVRLWYTNATIYGCTRAFDTRKASDHKDILKVLRFLSLQEHSGQLSGYWNPASKSHIDIETDGATDTDSINAQVKEHRVRPGPFGGRTAVFVEQQEAEDQGRANKIVLIKVSWLYEYLRSHELRMLRGIQGLNLPHAPQPIGLAVIATAGFQNTTAETLTTSTTSMAQADLFHYSREYSREYKAMPRHRTASALVTKQYLGDHIGTQVSMPDLVHIHTQVVEQLLKLAKGGYHYRDFNPGNVRLLRGTRNTLLFIDFGNMRTNISPLQQSGVQMRDAEALAARAADDGRSANPIWLSTCCAEASSAAADWDLALRYGISDLYAAFRAGPGSTGHVGRRKKEIKGILGCIHESLRKVTVYCHRYTDDLEGAVYLHYTQVANRWPWSDKVQKAREKELREPSAKQTLWESDWKWKRKMEDGQGIGSNKEWTPLMCALRKTIHAARKKLSKTLERQFNRKVPLEAFQEAFDAWKDRLTAEQLNEIKRDKDEYNAAQKDKLQLKPFILDFFDGKGLLDDNKITKIEKKCFKACIKLLKEGAEKMQAKEEESTRSEAGEADSLDGSAETSEEKSEDEDEGSTQRSKSETGEGE